MTKLRPEKESKSICSSTVSPPFLRVSGGKICLHVRDDVTGREEEQYTPMSKMRVSRVSSHFSRGCPLSNICNKDAGKQTGRFAGIELLW